MTGRAALLAAGGGGLSSVVALVLFSGSPFAVLLVYVAPLPLLLTGLALGPAVFGLAAATGLAVTLGFGSFTAAGLYGGMHVIPSWLVVQQALALDPGSDDGWRPVGRVMAALALLIAFVLTATALIGQGDQQQDLEAQMRAVLTAVVESAAPALEEPVREELVATMAPLFLGFGFVLWFAVIIGNALLAQWLLARRHRAQRPMPRLSEVRLPGWFDWVLVAMAVTALAAPGNLGFVARNASVVLLAPYFLVGVAVVHVLARQTAATGAVLSAFYMVVMVFSVVAGPVVVGLGVIEQWIGVRRRLAGAGRRSV